jgi:hypothetical protein
MGEITVVDTAALAAAGRTTSACSRGVLTATGATGPPLDRLAGELPGARVAHQAMALRQVVSGVLGELGRALDGWSRLLAAAGVAYGRAESEAVASAERGSP